MFIPMEKSVKFVYVIIRKCVHYCVPALKAMRAGEITGTTGFSVSQGGGRSDDVRFLQLKL